MNCISEGHHLSDFSKVSWSWLDTVWLPIIYSSWITVLVLYIPSVTDHPSHITLLKSNFLKPTQTNQLHLPVLQFLCLSVSWSSQPLNWLIFCVTWFTNPNRLGHAMGLKLVGQPLLYAISTFASLGVFLVSSPHSFLSSLYHAHTLPITFALLSSDMTKVRYITSNLYLSLHQTHNFCFWSHF